MIIFEKSSYYSDENPANEANGLPGIILRALHARGIYEPSAIERFLNPSANDFHDPFLLPDMDRAAARIRRALEEHERICVFGDYDVDGICSTSMLVSYFRSVGADCVYHIPSRKEEGYGMSMPAIERLAAQGVRLIITVDNGISAADEIASCYELGMDVVVTDHHIPGDRLPKCEAVVCHTVPSSRYPCGILCGAGIAFKLLHALAGLDAAMEYVAFAGLATVADVVPLVDENRILVSLGLDALNSGRCAVGLSRMAQSIANVRKPYTSSNLGFSIAPRLNASGRMSDASLAVELFLEQSLSRMDEIIAELNRLNELRQQEEADILSSAVEMLSDMNLSDTRVIALSSPDWNPGVIGVAASRISEMFYRPTILFSESNGMLKGSARSIEGINIHSVLNAHSELYERFGGHSKAAGVTLSRDRFDEFVSGMERTLEENYDNTVFIPRRRYEFDVDLSEISFELVSELARLAPFGEGNPSPVFRARHVTLSHIRCFGNDGQHMRMSARTASSRPIEAVWFGSGSNFDRILSAASVDILFTVDINRRGFSDCLQLRLLAVNNELPEDKHSYVEMGMPRFCSAFIENHSYSGRAHTERNERICIDLKRLSMENLSGLLILVFSTEAAERILAEVSEQGIINMDVCYTHLPSSPTCANTILIAPMLYMLPRKGYDRIIFYDKAPTQDVYDAIYELLPDARFYENESAASDFAPIARRFECSRDFFGAAFKHAESKLLMRPYSYGELINRCAQELRVPNYWIEFAVAVFFELGFICCDANCAVTLVQDAPCRRLSESPLYAKICALQGRN